MKAELVTEIAFSFPNEVGILARTSRAFSDAEISIEGMLNYSKGSTTDTYMVLSNKIDKAKEILTEAGVESIGQGNIDGPDVWQEAVGDFQTVSSIDARPANQRRYRRGQRKASIDVLAR